MGRPADPLVEATFLTPPSELNYFELDAEVCEIARAQAVFQSHMTVMI